MSALMGLGVAVYIDRGRPLPPGSVMSGAALGTVAGLLTRDVAPYVIFHGEFGKKRDVEMALRGINLEVTKPLCEQCKEFLKKHNASDCQRKWSLQNPDLKTVIRILHDASCAHPQCRFLKLSKHAVLSSLLGLVAAISPTNLVGMHLAGIGDLKTGRGTLKILKALAASGAIGGAGLGLLHSKEFPDNILDPSSETWLLAMQEALSLSTFQNGKITDVKTFIERLASDLRKTGKKIPDKVKPELVKFLGGNPIPDNDETASVNHFDFRSVEDQFKSALKSKTRARSIRPAEARIPP
jgi:hypothetical protein